MGRSKWLFAGLTILGLAASFDAHALQGKGKGKKAAAAAPAKKGKVSAKEKTAIDPLPPPREAAPAPAPEAAAAGGGGGGTVELRGPTRIDFDDRLIQGQTNKSGAVYLFDRKETGISSMVKRRKSFRALTVGTVYDR